MRKGRLAHYAAGHKSARNAHLLAFKLGKVFNNVSGISGNAVIYLYKRVVALRNQLLQLFAADSRLLCKAFCFFLCG